DVRETQLLEFIDSTIRAPSLRHPERSEGASTGLMFPQKLLCKFQRDLLSALPILWGSVFVESRVKAQDHMVHRYPVIKPNFIVEIDDLGHRVRRVVVSNVWECAPSPHRFSLRSAR